ncbi:nucleoside-diphosphate sugar epimerase/dehydratase [Telmatospirillum sp.]|uniref:polysaccharide biosynthesis protein n=1 Tax=Telmatospirillum sp. TaxID=2079197 RepID=UPI002843B94A|nr:nucleoside-diphosphate sugar epimerase/dehydratase [Telmatospirillum sp.]MDR3441058.1 nucleoside-diphosphate sugar epimerase/dehydratase [Telmatospirillum sp.]
MRAFRINRGAVAFVHDLVMAALSFVLSLWLRLGDSMGQTWDGPRLAIATGLFVLVAAPVFLSQRMYRGIWRFASVNDLITITRAATLTILVFLPLMFLLTRLNDLPRSTLLINWFALLVLLGAPRFLYRLLKDRHVSAAQAAGDTWRIPVLVLGTGSGADLFLRATMRSDAQYRVVGLLSLTPGRVGRGIHGVEVLGTLDQLEEVVASLRGNADGGPERLILSEETVDGTVVRRLFDRVDALGMTLSRLPRLTDLKDGVVDKVELRPVAVEDLLGRPQTVLDRAAMHSLIEGRRVLVTGAGGSIGSELVRQIAECRPASLSLVESSEFALYTIDREMAERHPELPRAALIANVRDRARINGVMAARQPELVFHAAALKHVPMVEANPLEGCLTNAVGTRIVADSCLAHGVALMVLISTDKAVNPTNVMGAAKRMAETYSQALDSQPGEGRTRFVTVRFGNVLGSTGSVVPLFQRQLAAGGPITVTHPEMTRYFMTIREAVELVLQASALGYTNPERYQGRIFVLDMGEPVKIVHLARQMIRLAGLRPDVDVKIVYTGLRPGEKLFEEIFHGAEAPVPTELDGILVAAVRALDFEAVAAALVELETACRQQDSAGALAVLHTLVPEYRGGAPAALPSAG